MGRTSPLTPGVSRESEALPRPFIPSRARILNRGWKLTLACWERVVVEHFFRYYNDLWLSEGTVGKSIYLPRKRESWYSNFMGEDDK